MKKILVLGAGRSSSSLISYLISQSKENNWQVTVGDFLLKNAEEKVKEHGNARAIQFDIADAEKKKEEIESTDIVISLLPPSHHHVVAEACIEAGKPLVTASYISSEINALEEKARQKNVLVLMECGLDPGIDHMSAMQEINHIKEQGGEIISFSSYTGGLVAPECDNNPWNYKVSWNPKNVVLAGQGTVKYIEDGQYKYIPYHKVFSRLEKIGINGYGEFEGYANRDSLKYRPIYDLQEASTFIRGTLRRTGYCTAWNVFVQLGMTEDSYVLEGSSSLSYKEFISSYLPEGQGTGQERLKKYLGVSDTVLSKIEWLGLFSDEEIGEPNFTPAQVLQKLIEKKWKLQKEDKDMIVMQHKFVYTLQGKKTELTSSLVSIGDDAINTAMAKTVGLPLGIVAKLILQGKIKLKGVQIPVIKEIYEPVLNELKEYGIEFRNEIKLLS